MQLFVANDNIMIINTPDSATKINQKKYFKYFLILILLTIFHSIFLEFIEIMDITPDLLIILVVWITVKEGRFIGLIAGFVIGLYTDAITVDVLGTNALAKTIAAFVASCFYKENNLTITKNMKFVLIVLLSVFVHNVPRTLPRSGQSDLLSLPVHIRHPA